MMNVFADGGTMMWIITMAGLLMLGLAGRAALSLRAPGRDPAAALASADASLFWGGLAGLLGVLGTLVGVMQAARAVQAAGAVDGALAWAGIRVTLITTVYGLLIVLVALLLWGALRTAARRGGPAAVGERRATSA